jgi:hypothetical protein
MNRHRLAEEQWDVALSNGHRAWLMANDDAHSVKSLRHVQRSVTFVNTSESTGNAVLESLARGAAFGVQFPRMEDPTIEKILQASAKVSFPVSIGINEDSLLIRWGQTMEKIEFIGNHGNLLKTVTDNDFAYCLISQEETYLRIKLTCSDGYVYLINPIIRNISGNMPELQILYSVDVWETLSKRAIIILLLISILSISILKIETKRLIKKQSTK